MSVSSGDVADLALGAVFHVLKSRTFPIWQYRHVREKVPRSRIFFAHTCLSNFVLNESMRGVVLVARGMQLGLVLMQAVFLIYLIPRRLFHRRTFFAINETMKDWIVNRLEIPSGRVMNGRIISVYCLI